MYHFFSSLIVFGISVIILESASARVRYIRTTPILEDIQVGDFVNYTQIALILSKGKYTCKITPLTQNPPVLMVKLTGVKKGSLGNEFRAKSFALDKIGITGTSKTVTLTIPLKQNNNNKSLVDLSKIHWHPWEQLVTIDLPLTTSNHTHIPPVEEIEKLKNDKNNPVKVVVIDPGHGGFNTGTSGGSLIRGKKLVEKEVAMDVSKRLERMLKKDPRFLPLLTRYGDYNPGPFGAKGKTRHEFYMKHSVPYRVELAKEYLGNIYVSIHLNSPGRSISSQRRVRGFEIYYLGDKHAESLLNNKNMDLEDLAALGVDKERDGDPSILTLLKRNKIPEESKLLAASILNEFKQIKGVVLRERPILPHRYIVLKQFNMPSVLVELCFLSHPTDHAFVKKPDNREKMAAALYTAIQNYYFHSVDIPPVMIAKAEKSDLKADKNTSTTPVPIPTYHTVRKNETLDSIARQYGTTWQVLKSLNRNKIGRRNTITPGQRLLLPSGVKSKSTSSSKASTSTGIITYTVKPRDTLGKIAIQYRTQVAMIKKLNNKKRSLIHPGETLKVQPGNTASKKSAKAPTRRYRVRRGDALSKIARRFGTTVTRLKRANGIRGSLINEGDVLLIP